MAHSGGRADGGSMSREQTTVGSEDGHGKGRGDYDQDGLVGATETAGLLGDAPRREGEEQPLLSRKDAWNNMDDFEGQPWWRTPSVYWLIGPYALFTLAFGGSLVPKLNMIIDLVCKRYFSDRSTIDPAFTFLPVTPGGNNPQCRIPEVQANVATFSMIVSVIVGTLSAFTAPRLGALSDRLGRKPIMVISSCGGLLGEVIFILASNYPDLIHYKWLIASSFVDGLSGSFTAGSIMSHSYTSDCTPPSKRAVSIGYMHACLFTGMAFGPLLAGYFVEWTGSLLSIFYVTLGCHIVFIFYILFLLPESVSKRRREAAWAKHAKLQAQRAREDGYDGSPNRSGGLPWLKKAIRTVRESSPLAPLKILAPPGSRSSRVRRNLIVLAAIDTILLSSAMSSGSVTQLYTVLVFHWGNLETSKYVSLLSAVRVVILMGIFPVINYVFRTRVARRQRRESGIEPVEQNAGADGVDVWLIRTAIVSDIIGAVGYVVVRDPRLFVLSGVITAFGGLGSATIQSSLTKHVPADRVGELLGATGLLHAIGRIVAQVLFNGVYAATVYTFPQAAFVVVAAAFGIVQVLTFFVRPHVYMTEDGVPSPPPSPRPRVTDPVEDEVVPQI